MELLLLDKNFQICGLIDDFSSLVWNRKYYECGSFNLQLGLNYWEQLKNAKYVYSKNFNETGILETLNYKTTEQGTEIQMSGRFLESILANRVINKTQNFKNIITEDIIRSLVDTFVINAGERTISNVVLGERKGFGKKRTIQITGDNLLTKIYELCKEDELSIKLWYDFDNNKLVFEVWQGIDRRDTQNENTWAIFSKNFENILQDEYSTDETKYCNFAYVAGEGKAENRVIVEVNKIKENEDIKSIISRLTDEMLEHAANMEFEKAAELRDKIKELEKLDEN